MAELDTRLVNIGLTPNDGTGNNLRDAFIKTNQNITAITEFLMLAPMLSNLTVRNGIATSSITANTGVFSDGLHISSNVESISPTTGALTVVGGAGILGNVNVGGTIYGDVEGNVVTASTLGVNGGSILRGNVMTGALSVGSNLDKKDLIVTRNAEIWGELTVHGNVTTVSTSVFNVEHPVITVGKAANVDLSANDGKDRGVEFFWFDDAAVSQKEGFFGFQNSSQKFTYIPRSSYSSPNDTDIFLGAYGDARFNEVEANIVSSGTSTFNNIVSSTITATNGYTGPLLTNAQPNITSIGTLADLSIKGNVSVINGDVHVTGGALYINGIPAATSAGAFHGGTVALDTIFISNTSSLTTSSGAVRVVGGVGVTGNVNVGEQINAPIITATTITGTLTTPDQPSITSIGTLGNLIVTDSFASYSVSAHHATFGSYINSATVGGIITTAAQPNITSVGTLSNLNVTGSVVAASFTGDLSGSCTGNAATATLANNFVNQANSATIVASPATTPDTIVLRDATGNFAAGVITASAINALYADLAEMYESDSEYEPGTVLIFGGSREVTTTGSQADLAVAGVVSTAPAYLMNIDAKNAVAVALRGRAPVKLMGPVRKGDLLVTSYVAGYAVSVGKSTTHTVAVFGKSLTEDLSEGAKLIEAVII